MPDDLTCFIGQKAFIERSGKLLILHDPQLGVDMPGGKVQVGEEDLAASLKREVIEETGLTIEVGKPFFTWMYTIPPQSTHRSAGKKIFSVSYRCHYVSGDVTLSPEHDWFKWIDKTNYKVVDDGSGFSPVLDVYFNT